MIDDQRLFVNTENVSLHYIYTQFLLLCRTMGGFEWNLHNQNSSGDSVQSTTFCGNQVMDTTFFVP